MTAALDLLAEHAGDKALAAACCAGCREAEAPRHCTEYRALRCCANECLTGMRPMRTPVCRARKAEAVEAQPQDD